MRGQEAVAFQKKAPRAHCEKSLTVALGGLASTSTTTTLSLDQRDCTRCVPQHVPASRASSLKTPLLFLPRLQVSPGSSLPPSPGGSCSSEQLKAMP